MDWSLVIERNGRALRAILATLVAMAGLDARPEARAEGEPRRMPRHLHRAILRLLRPAEAAARRLVIVVAREIAPPSSPQATSSASQGRRSGGKPGTRLVPRSSERRSASGSARLRAGSSRPPAARAIALPLFDRLRPYVVQPPASRGVPRISVPGYSVPFAIPVRTPPSPGDLLDATRLVLRIRALGRALDDLPGHARRFARWRARVISGAQVERLPAANCSPARARRLSRVWPLRPGRPPGSRRRPTHQVHEVLADLHHFAFHALQLPPLRWKGGQSP